MLRERPFASSEAMFEAADRIWSGLAPSDYLEAFEHHPQIGEDLGALKRKFGSTADWAAAEQSGAAAAEVDTLRALRDANRTYLARFGFIFVVCATGKSAEEMLAMMRERSSNAPEVELRIAAAEQAKITKLRLSKLSI